MPPKKKTKVAGQRQSAYETAVAIHQLEDLMANILGWLPVNEIMGKRRVCKKWKEAARKTIVPLCDFSVDDVQKYNAMGVMTTEMPNLQQITIRGCGWRHKYSDGEDPDEEVAQLLADYTPHDIDIIPNFSMLRILKINKAKLNGRYPFLFNSFPLLQKLSVYQCHYLKWDLEMLAGFPVLKELDCESNYSLTGNIISLKVLKETLQKVKIFDSKLVEGNFMDLADFPHLKELDLLGTSATGDIRDIGENDFSTLEHINFPEADGYELQRISDAPEFIRAVYLLNKQRPVLKIYNWWYGKLSESSPDWYGPVDEFDYPPPFYIRIVAAGSRVGYRWMTNFGPRDESCEVNWLDHQPDRESSDYEGYVEELQAIEAKVKFYRGFHQPPTQEEYQGLVEDYESDSESYGEYNESESDE